MSDAANCGWRPGPLPPDTYAWGGVVAWDMDGTGFAFADFCGDHVIMCPEGRKLLPHEVKLFNNCLDLPNGFKGRAGALPS